MVVQMLEHFLCIFTVVETYLKGECTHCSLWEKIQIKKTIGREYHWEVRKLKERAYISQPVVLK